MLTSAPSCRRRSTCMRMPREVTARVPQTEGYQYTVADNRVLLVSPPTRIVVGVFPDPEKIQAGEGRRSP